MVQQTLAILLVAITGVLAQSCTHDYECRNNPYSICEGGYEECTSNINGLAIDNINNQIYFAQYCRSDYGVVNITLKKVSINGGASTVVLSTEQQYTKYYNNLDHIYLEYNNLLYVSYTLPAYYEELSTINLTTMSKSDIDTGANHLFFKAIDFDTSTGETYVCNLVNKYNIEKYEGLLGSTANTTATSLYSIDDMCTAVRSQVGGNNIFFTTVKQTSAGATTYFLEGLKSCNNCTNPIVLFSLANETVNDFIVVGNKFYFTSDSGVYSSDMNGGSLIVISQESAHGIRELNGMIYWNSGNAIYSARLDGSDQLRINSVNGQCGCNWGFAGSSCNACSGQVQWYNGSPSCVPFNNDGFPIRCREGFQCGHLPYTYCSRGNSYGECYCQFGLTNPPYCNTCTNSSQSIMWNSYGMPECA